MGISMMNNLGVMNTIRNISTIQRSLLKTSAKLSSGLRINQASDDPAGLVISERMRSQIGSIAQELTNLDNSINKSNVADKAMTEMEDQLIEIRELAIGAANSAANDDKTMQAYQNASDDQVAAYNRAIETTTYGHQKLLDGSKDSIAEIKALSDIDLSSPAKAVEAVEKIDTAMSELQATHGKIGSDTRNYTESLRGNLEITRNNMIASESAIRDTDYANEQTRAINLMLQQKVGLALLAQGNLQAESVFGLLSV